MDDSDHAKILSLPYDDSLQASNWSNGYVGIDILRWLTGRPIISTSVTLPPDGARLYYEIDQQTKSDMKSFSKVLEGLNIKYILLRNDASSHFRALGLSEIRSFLSKQENISLVASFGKLDLYQNANFMPLIYSSERLISVPDDGAFAFMVSRNFDASRDIITSISSNLARARTNVERPRNLAFSAVSPTEYLVEVKEATYPFVLVLAQTYDPNWKVVLNGIPISEGFHFKVNGYANGWLVNQTGSFGLTIQYVPQMFAYLGAWVSIIAVLTITIVLPLIVLRKPSARGRDVR